MRGARATGAKIVVKSDQELAMVDFQSKNNGEQDCEYGADEQPDRRSSSEWRGRECDQAIAGADPDQESSQTTSRQTSRPTSNWASARTR